jgi:chemotaxis protein methyltransferase CheR
MSAARADEYTDFCLQVHRLCRIDLLQYKRGQMERRIRTFAQRRKVARLADYAEVLKADPAEREAFLDRITINVSQLWRNPEQWLVLGKAVLPELARHRRVRAWSAGSSYGAEAFTLAAVAAEAIPGHAIAIRGTDIDARMVDRARTGEFSRADVRDAPPALLKRWFVPTDGGWRAKDELRRVVRFEQGDLLRMRVAPASLDLVLCRNTVIYFNDEVRDALHARLAAALRPGGCLVVGATERVADPGALGLASTHPFTYRKS